MNRNERNSRLPHPTPDCNTRAGIDRGGVELIWNTDSDHTRINDADARRIERDLERYIYIRIPVCELSNVDKPPP